MTWKGRGLTALIVAAVLVALAWLVWRPSDPLFHGQRESAWIMSLNQPLRDEQIAQWRAFGPEAVPVLIKAVRKGTGPMEKKYVKLRPKLPGWLRQRLTPPVDVSIARYNAARLLGNLGADAKPAAPALARAMNDPDPNLRVNSARALEAVLPVLGSEKKRLLGNFLTALGDTNYVVRADAISFLVYYPNDSAMVSPVLIKALDDPERSVRTAAMSALNAMNSEAAARAGVVPPLVNQLKNQDVTIRVFAARRLGSIRQQPKIVVPALTELLGDDASVVRFAAATALGGFGNEARPAVPALVKLLDTAEPQVRTAALNALNQIDPRATAKIPAPAREERK